MPADAAEILAVRGLTRRFGGVTAVDDLAFSIRRGEKVAVIGPNGAGKSTLLRLIAGQDRPTRGTIELDGPGRVEGRSAHHLARLGVSLARQVPKPLRSLSVQDNIRVGLAAGHSRRKGAPSARLEDILELTGLMQKRSRAAAQLPLLDLKRLEVARALATEPKLLLLDEVSAGLNESDLDQAIALIAEIHRRGTSLLIVEHVQKVVHDLADRVLVLNWGSLIASGTPQQISADAEVGRIYLGTRPDAETTPTRPAAREPGSGTTGGLVVESVSAARGSITALTEVSITVRTGEIVSVLGANGAGKTSLTQVISGLLPTSAGRLVWNGEDITALPSHRRAGRRIAHCQEGRKLFPGLTVAENLELGAFGVPKAERAERQDLVYQVFPMLADRRSQIATTMSGGQQQMVAIGRALMSNPRLLLLDEISLGLAPVVIEEIYAALPDVIAHGTATVLVEQDIGRALRTADRFVCLREGRIVLEGVTGDAVRAEITEAYFGAHA